MFKPKRKKVQQIRCAHPKCRQGIHLILYKGDGLYYMLKDGIARMVHKPCFINICIEEGLEDDLVNKENLISAPQGCTYFIIAALFF